MYRVEVIRHRLRKVIVIKFHELDHVPLMKMRAYARKMCDFTMPKSTLYINNV